MEELLLPLFMVLFYLMLLLDLEKLHNLIVDIDLRPSMTQFLIVIIFTPILLMAMHYYAQEENLYKTIVSECNFETTKFDNLKNKYEMIEALIDNTKTDSTFSEANPEFVSYKFDKSVENFSKALTEYQEAFNMAYLSNQDMDFAANFTIVNFDKDHSNIMFLNHLTNNFRTQQYKFFSIYIKYFENSYKRIKFKEIEEFHNLLLEKQQLSLKSIRLIQTIYFYLAALFSYIIFRLILLILKFYYIEKILLNKLEKIISIDTWTNSQKNVILEWKKILFHQIYLNSGSLFEYIKFRINLFKFDKELNTMIDIGNIKTVENKCTQILDMQNKKKAS